MRSESELEKLLGTPRSNLGVKKLQGVRLLDKLTYERWDKVPSELAAEAHAIFIDGLIDYYLEHIKAENSESEKDAVRRVIAWSMGNLLDNYGAFLNKRKEGDILEDISGALGEARELKKTQTEEIMYRPQDNTRNVSLVKPVLPRIGRREASGGKVIELSWPHEKFLDKKAYALKPHRESPVRDINKVKKYLRMMGSHLLEKYTDHQGMPADIVIAPELNKETRQKYRRSANIISYNQFGKIIDEYEPGEVPAGIADRVRMYWGITPNNTMPTTPTKRKAFYNLEATIKGKILPEIEKLGMEETADRMLVSYISKLLKNVADFYVTGRKDRTVIHKLRHRFL